MPKPDRRSLSEQIKDALLDQITAGEFKPGDRLVELSIAETMQTSQAPVREALRTLAALGIIEMRRNRGAVVRTIDRDEIGHIYQVRAALEATALRSADAQSLAQKLHDLCDAMERAEDPLDFVDLNTTFHRAIVTAGGNPVLTEIWDQLDIRARTAANIARPASDRAAARADHRRIAELLAQGNGRAAQQALEDHIRAVLGPPNPA